MHDWDVLRNFTESGIIPHVLTELRSAFDALAEAYSQKDVGKDAWEKILTHTHAGVRDKLLDSFLAFRQF